MKATSTELMEVQMLSGVEIQSEIRVKMRVLKGGGSINPIEGKYA